MLTVEEVVKDMWLGPNVAPDRARELRKVLCELNAHIGTPPIVTSEERDTPPLGNDMGQGVVSCIKNICEKPQVFVTCVVNRDQKKTLGKIGIPGGRQKQFDISPSVSIKEAFNVTTRHEIEEEIGVRLEHEDLLWPACKVTRTAIQRDKHTNEEMMGGRGKLRTAPLTQFVFFYPQHVLLHHTTDPDIEMPLWLPFESALYDGPELKHTWFLSHVIPLGYALHEATQVFNAYLFDTRGPKTNIKDESDRAMVELLEEMLGIRKGVKELWLAQEFIPEFLDYTRPRFIKKRQEDGQWKTIEQEPGMFFRTVEERISRITRENPRSMLDIKNFECFPLHGSEYFENE